MPWWIALGLITAYVVMCIVWPYAACRACDGSGKHRSPGRGSWRDCWRCRGSGKRVRLGRRAWDRFHRGRRQRGVK